MSDRQTVSETTVLLWIVGLSLAIQVGLMLYVGERMYPDVVRAVHFGRDVMAERISIHTHLDNTKTFVGPILWYQLYQATGLWGLRAFNLIAFAGLLVVQYRLGREMFSRWIVLGGVFLVAFYPGSHRNVTVGELDDLLASLLLALGVYLLVRFGGVALGALVMGSALVFKFWALIFIGGLLLHLLLARRWRDLAVAAVSSAAPFLLVDLLSDGAAVKAFLWSVGRQTAQSSWRTIGFRMMSTGLLVTNVLAVWSFLRHQTEQGRLLLLLSVPYFAYVLLMRDAHAVSFVMMICLVFSSFLITDLWAGFDWRRGAVVAILGLYLLAGVSIASLNLTRDTRAFYLRDKVMAPRFDGRSD